MGVQRCPLLVFKIGGSRLFLPRQVPSWSSRDAGSPLAEGPLIRLFFFPEMMRFFVFPIGGTPCSLRFDCSFLISGFTAV